MAGVFATQLQPYEENQSSSPIDKHSSNPFDALALSRSRSSGRFASSPPSPVATTNTLHRQLSSDPECPPPAWKRRSTVSTRVNSQIDRRYSPQASRIQQGGRPSCALSESSQFSQFRLPPSSRRHPNLMMTTRAPAPLPSAMFLHESPNTSSTSLSEMDLPFPQPAFRRRGGNLSNRSSIISSSDTSGLTSEDLWRLEQDAVPDMSNPERKAAERPLDTVRRMSRQVEQSWSQGLPVDVIWPSAPPPSEDYAPPVKSKSFTHVPSLSRKPSRLGRKRTVRQGSMDADQLPKGNSPYQQAKSDPSTPIFGLAKPDSAFLSSAHSSSTSLASHPLPVNKSHPALGSRPPSAYYSRDFLSSLAPREGGYAVAAMMGNGLGAVGTMSVEERRRSTVYEEHRPRSMAQAPVAKSAGMGRWSLDGGEHFPTRPYGNPSPATTTANFSAAPRNSPEDSPHTPYTEELASPTDSLPQGPFSSVTGAPQGQPQRIETDLSPIAAQVPSSAPITPSPLSRAFNGDRPNPAPAQPAAIPISLIPAQSQVRADGPALSPKKSKKEIKKAAKAAEKAEAARIAGERAEAARQATLKKQQQREAEAKVKEEAKRKEREEKERRKVEKKSKGKSTAVPSPPAAARQPVQQPIAAQYTVTREDNLAPSLLAVPSQFPRSHSDVKVNTVPSAAMRVPRLSLGRTLEKPIPPTPTSAPLRDEPKNKPRLGFLGTIKKRLSVVDTPRTTTSAGTEASAPVVRPTPGPTPPPKMPRAQEVVVVPPEEREGRSWTLAPSTVSQRSIGRESSPDTSTEGQMLPARSTPQPAALQDSAPVLFPISVQPASVPVAIVSVASMTDTSLPPRSSSFQHVSAPPPIVTQSFVPDSPEPSAPPSSSTSVKRNRSVAGPRPMRSPSFPRPASVVSHASGSANTPSSSSDAAAQSSSFPFSATASAVVKTPSSIESGGVPQSHAASSPIIGAPLSSGAGSGLSQIQSHPSISSHSNDMLTISDLESPFSVSSMKSSMTSADAEAVDPRGLTPFREKEGELVVVEPARESSKSSKETIHPEVSGALVVSAH